MRTPPNSAIPHQSVEDRKQLPHARYQRHLLGLARLKQPPVKLLEDRIVASGYQCPHVEGHPERRPPPQTSPLPRSVPESRLKGATPTRAERRLGASDPSSGSSASTLLVSAFAAGVWTSATPKLAARITGAMLLGYALTGMVTGWIFPQNTREALAAGEEGSATPCTPLRRW